MRPIELKMSGLNSYRELQEIDFETLCEAGLFGIFGPTGSGKSSILDAITLALYGQVVRTGGGSHPQEVLNQLESTLYVSFTFELGQEQNRTRYTIEREFGLTKGGNRKQPEVRLIERSKVEDIPDQVLESKATAATAMIEQLIGLTIHDFTRAVVLPQGQFSKFLTLKGSERNEMLQRIFHLHEYGEKLMQKVKGQLERNKQTIHQLEVEQARLGDASQEALEQAQNEAEQLENQIQEITVRFEALTLRKKEWEQIRQWQMERNDVQSQLNLLSEREEEMIARKHEIANIETSLALWPFFSREIQLQQEWQETEGRLLRTREERKQVQEKWELVERTSLEAKSKLRQEEPIHLERKSEWTQALEWEREMAQLSSQLQQVQNEQNLLQQKLNQADQEYKKLEQERLEATAVLNKLDEEWHQSAMSVEERKSIRTMLQAKQLCDQENTRLQETEKEWQESQEKLNQGLKALAQHEVAFAGATGLRNELEQEIVQLTKLDFWSEEETGQARETLVKVMGIGKEWRDQVKAKTDWDVRWIDTEKLLHTAIQITTGKETSAVQAEANRNACKEQQDAWTVRWNSWQKANMAHALRNELQPDHECPVCGSLHHPLSEEQHEDTQPIGNVENEEKELTLEKEKLEQALIEAEKILRTASEDVQKAKVDLAQIGQRKEMLQEEQAGLVTRKQEILSQLHELGEEWRVSSIEGLGIAYKQCDQQVREQTELRTRHSKKMEEKQKELRHKRDDELEKKAEWEKWKSWAEGQREQGESIATRLEMSRQSALQASNKLNQARGEIGIEQIESLFHNMEQLEQRQEELRRLRLAQEQRHQELQALIQTKKEEWSHLQAQSIALQEKVLDRKEQWTKKQEQWQKRTGGESAEVLLKKVNEAIADLHQRSEQAEKEMHQVALERQQIMETAVALEETYGRLGRQTKEAEAEMEQALAEARLVDRNSVQAYYNLRPQLTTFKADVEAYMTQLTEVRYALTRLEERLDGREVKEEEWQELLIVCTGDEEALTQIRESSTLAREKVMQLEKNHERWQSMTQEMTEVTDEQSRLDELRKLFEGKAFVQYIAEEKMTTIARDASYHLARMTKGRYALEIGDGGEFVLRDEAAGGMKRPVQTLSGGETFLTSLALALALSVEIQMRGGRLEFFFLDEGFGTLDSELLEIVLDALEKLRMDHFTIGLISHVPELKLRMPRRLIVTPAEPMGAGSKITLEVE
ncbi:AAA family ATPase [Brevibacillus daliensis]|uniref:AAA family ATPase n=1 Tax=Brevibacillus daliensis TaxID=2892995 RepID=UPI001E589159|nr:SMC family ATPase [Brevibacillus daliensis]